MVGFLCLAMLGTFFQNLLGTTFRLNAFVGAVGVALVIVPVITSLTEDALRAVPTDLRVASYGLGATPLADDRRGDGSGSGLGDLGGAHPRYGAGAR